MNVFSDKSNFVCSSNETTGIVPNFPRLIVDRLVEAWFEQEVKKMAANLPGLGPQIAAIMATVSMDRDNHPVFQTWKRQTLADMNFLLLGVYANSKGVPDRVSAFVSNTENKMIECPVWENVDFNNEKQVEAIIAKLNELVSRYNARPLQVRDLLPLAKCNKCKKTSNVMVWISTNEGGELEGRLRHACCPCKNPGEFLG